MTDELKPVRCGCGGRSRIEFGEEGICRVRCSFCLTGTVYHRNKAEAITAWNRAMKGLLPEGDPQKNVGVEFTNSTERTAKVVEHDASITDTDGYKYLRTEYICDACKKKVLGGDEYCSHCGCRLEWE